MPSGEHIRIRIETRQSLPSDPDGMKVRSELLITEAEGVRREVAGATHILFEEREEESAKADKIHLVIRDGSVELKRSGQITSSFLFAAGADTPAQYRTPYGEIPMRIRTRSLLLPDGRAELYIRILYDILSGEELLSTNEVSISIKKTSGF